MKPLAERLRPTNLDDYVGQQHLVGPGAVLRNMIDAGRITSFILWGPPGVGKTTLARIVATQLKAPFYTLSAVNSGVKDVRDVIEKAAKIDSFPIRVLFFLLMKFIAFPSRNKTVCLPPWKTARLL